MILHGFLKNGLHTEHSLVDGRRVVAIERDHLRTGFAASDDFERICLDAGDRGIGDGRGGSRLKPSSEPARLVFIIGVSVAPG